MTASGYGEQLRWQPTTPRFRLVPSIVNWMIGAAAVWVAAWIVPGVALGGVGAAFVVAAVIAVLNAFVPPRAGGAAAAVHARRRLPPGAGRRRAACCRLADGVLADDIRVDSFGDALLAALRDRRGQVVLAGDPRHQRRRRVHAARDAAHRPPPGRSRRRTDVPGILFLEIDGLALPVLRDAMRDGSAPNMARWIADEGYRLAEWEPDLSSQTGASQAGILLGSNEDIPAFRWVEKERGRMMVCSSPADCAEIERPPRHRRRAARRRRGEPRQPALRRGRRGDPHRQPHGRRAAAPTPATAPSSPTASTSPGRSCCSSGRSCSRSPPRCAPPAATSARAATAAASTR